MRWMRGVGLGVVALTVACTGGDGDGTTSSSSGGSSSSGVMSSSAAGSSSRAGGSSSSSSSGAVTSSSMAVPANPCGESIFGYPVLLHAAYGNEAAGSLFQVNITGNTRVVERVSGQADVTTMGEISAEMNVIQEAVAPAQAGTLQHDLGISSPNEGRRGAVVLCQGGEQVLVREEGPDPDTGYWLVVRNTGAPLQGLLDVINARVAVDTPQ